MENFQFCSVKGAIEVVGELKLVDLTFDTIKILGVHFPHNKETHKCTKGSSFVEFKELSLEGRIMIS